MQNTLLANPHSDASNPSASSTIVAETRLKVLRFFNADPNHFDIVFTANATAAAKLVMDCFAGHTNGFNYCYHRNCHTSLVGVREVARRSHCFATDEETEHWLHKRRGPSTSWDDDQPILFAYPAQSNMNGARLPLHWPQLLRKSRNHTHTYTLLDVAAFVSTSPLDLSNHASAPDFTVLSFYKIFGFPDLGALIVRKESSHMLEHRKYFGGGTTEMATCFGEKPWVARKEASLHARLEDGTIAIRSILALRCAIDVHRQLFGDMDQISKHTGWLAKRLYERLSAMRYSNGTLVFQIYKAPSSKYGDPETQGATIALNVRKSDRSWMGPYAFGAMLRGHNIHVRTGSLCNPAGMASALGLSPEDLRVAFDEGFRCNQHDDVREGGVLFGMVRVTLGAMTTVEDIKRFLNCIEEQLVGPKSSIRSTLILHQVNLCAKGAEKVPRLFEEQRPYASNSAKSCGRFKSIWRAVCGCLQ
jgi:molybdenum cofactor sulfurtransferase